MLASPTKKLNRSKGEQRASGWCNDGAGGGSSGGSGGGTHTGGRGSGGGEEDGTEPIKYTPDKKILVVEIKKQQRRREGKRVEKSSTKKGAQV